MSAVAAPAPAPADGALAPPPGHPRFDRVDGLRGLAALSVLVFHAGASTLYNSRNDVLGPLTARLDAGVALFFCISGFLLYRPFAAARLRGAPSPAVGAFYLRRLVRIVPAYWVALTVLAIVPPGLAGGVGSFPHGLRFYLFAQNLSLTTVDQGIGPAWTLCVELAFYLLLPLYAALVARLPPAPDLPAEVRRELWLLGALAVASVMARGVAYGHGGDAGLRFQFLLPAFGLWFALRMALALLSVEAAATPRAVRVLAARPVAVWGAAGALLLTAYVAGLPRGLLARYTVATWTAEHVLYGLVAVLVLAPAVLSEERAGARVLRWRPVVAFGLVSYGVYLYHLPPMVDWARDDLPRRILSGAPFPTELALGLTLATAAATASWWLVERPLLRRVRPAAVRAADRAPRAAAAPAARTR